MSAAIAVAGSTACVGPVSITRFEKILAENHSATAALTQWCRMRGMTDLPEIVARSVKSGIMQPNASIRTLLAVNERDAVHYRQVHLLCGDTVLSIAENWYVPARLTAEMNRMLDTTDIPFGRVVAPLGYTREQLASVQGAVSGCPEGTVLSVRAVLKLPDGIPISTVVECYTAANLARRR